MPDWGGFEPHRLLSALMLLVVALFVSSGRLPAARWRQRLRTAAVVLFVVALIAALVEIGRWLAGGGGFG